VKPVRWLWPPPANRGSRWNKVTDAVKQIDNIVTEMTRAADRATEHGQGVLTAAQEGARSVKETVLGMQAIAESSEKIPISSR
jgi:methyl-accepting chemotaxis protein